MGAITITQRSLAKCMEACARVTAQAPPSANRANRNDRNAFGRIGVTMGPPKKTDAKRKQNIATANASRWISENAHRLRATTFTSNVQRRKFKQSEPTTRAIKFLADAYKVSFAHGVGCNSIGRAHCGARIIARCALTRRSANLT